MPYKRFDAEASMLLEVMVIIISALAALLAGSVLMIFSK